MYRLAGILVAIAASASVAAAATETRYVSKQGNDSNTCLSSAAPCLTIAQAVSMSDSTDTIYVAGGKYAESISLTDNGTLTISGSWDEAFTTTSSETPTVLSSKGARPLTLTYTDTVGDFTLSGVNISKSSPAAAENEGGALLATVIGATASLTLRLQDLEIVGNKASRVGGVSVTNWVGATADVRIENVLFAKNSATNDCGALKIAGQHAPPPNFEITDSVFEKNKSKGWGGAACFQGKDHSTNIDPVQIIANATFVKNKAYSGGAIHIPTFAGHQNLYMENSIFLKNKASYYGGAISMESLSQYALTECFGEMTSINNTFSDNKAKYAGAIVVYATQMGSTATTHSFLTSTNDIVYGNTSASGREVVVDAVPGATSTLTRDHGIYGSLLAMRGGSVVDGAGVLSVDPLFVKAGADIHLTDASPAIDAGTCTGAPTTDFEGTVRPTGAGCDIGADEH